MADKDVSFHGGNPGPSGPDGAYAFMSDGDGDDSNTSFAHPDTAYPPANPVAFGQSPNADSAK